MTRDPSEFAAPDNAALAGLIFELASQLHVERTRRAALEAALVQKGIVRDGEIESIVQHDEFRATNGAALDRSIRKLIAVLTEDEDRRRPLRAEASRQGGA
ncbi:MAG TPA: hypothetical protein VKZ79_08420 [Alphaproteobacteria bacterium]|nr:hypothetical protein [Alphaproteobacteria bacterium]